MIGKLLGNRYEIVKQLGGGGMAVVYKGKDTILNRMVTIKLLRAEFTSDEDFVRRFRREAQSVASLSHPNIVSIYDVGKENDLHYLVMEYVDGEDLRSVIKREGRLEQSRAVKIVQQICDALEHAHESQIVHRDVKPHNILLTKGGRAKLTDFGIAREASTVTMTGSDTIVGSVHYLSPEQARGEVAGPKSDIYSLGISFYEMLTGGVPFTGDTPIAIALKHIQDNPKPISMVIPDILPEIEHVVMRALQKDPDKRFSTVGDMSFQLEEALINNDSDTTRIIPLNPLEEKMLKKADINKQNRSEYYQQKPEVVAVGSKRISPAGWAMIITLIILLFAGFAYGYNKYINVPEMVVPDVVGKELQEAQQILADKGLKSKVVEKYHQTVPEGVVISQDPSSEGPPVKINRIIELTVSKGADLGTVPNVVKLSLAEARAKLTEAGFEADESVKEVASAEIEEGFVVSQQPDAYSRAPKRTKITLTVSKGPETALTMVDLKGLTLEQARIKLSEQGLEINPDIQHQSSTDYFRGQIIAQSPGPDQPVTRETSIKVTVSTGPGPSFKEVDVTVQVPDDGNTHEVRISIADANGTKDVYISTHYPGDRVKQSVRYWGKAVLRIYLDEQQIKEENLD